MNPELPPQNHEAEQAVLGAILLDPPALNVAVAQLHATDFYRQAHQQIFRAMQYVTDQGDALDTITLAAELERQGCLESSGGRSYLAELIVSVGSSANIRHHSHLTRQAKVLREMRTLGQLLQRKASGTEEAPESVLAWAEQALYQLAHGTHSEGFESVASIIGEAVTRIDLASKTPHACVGIPTGFAALDRVLSGLQPTDLIIIGARPSMGKTSFALTTARAAASAGFGVGFFSLEMSTQQLGLRLLSAESGIDSHALRTGQLLPSSWQPLAQAAQVLESLPLWVDETGDLTLTMLRAKARRLKAQHDIRLIIVDYLQLMQGGDESESRQQEISAISRGLKLMAKELHVAVLALSQLNRSLEGRIDKRPQLSDLRESGAIEQDADVVMMLYREEVYDRETPDRGIAEVLIKKQRNGPIGDVRLAWHEQTASFADL